MATGNKISVSSLNPAVKDGWLTKQGGSIRTWKKRWFVLKDDKLYYFKGTKDTEVTGIITLEPGAFVQVEDYEVRKKKHCFSVKPCNDAKRIYYIHADSPTDCKSWVDKLKEVISTRINGGNKNTNPTPTPTPSDIPEVRKEDPKLEAKEDSKNEGRNPGSTAEEARDLVAGAKDQVFFLREEEESKVLEFWQIWFESIPTVEELVAANNSLDYQVSTSLKMEKLTWRTAGPQNLFIQKMVDFFWNVGAPETEIDRLNDVGTLINPVKIGSWIDMSHKGGMDGGWYFPVTIALEMALNAADPGDPITRVGEWARKHKIADCLSVGRDMGAAPPRQTEIRTQLPGVDANSQLQIALDAHNMFEFPYPPDEALSLLREANKPGICLSIITSSDGFVRLGILSPNPSPDMISRACTLVDANKEPLLRFQNALAANGPSFIEFQYLKEGFGYGVYPEGFDIVLHYAVEENAE